MPIPETHLKELNPTQAIVWPSNKTQPNAGSTGSLLQIFVGEENPFFHSTPIDPKNPYQGTVPNMLVFNADKKFINFKNSFKHQFNALADYFSNINFDVANEKLSVSLGGLLEADPDIISMELTHEQSIFYTFKKDEYSFFIQHFLNDVDEEDDEAILTVFKGDEKLPSYAGSLSETIAELNSVLAPVNALKVQIESHELSI